MVQQGKMKGRNEVVVLRLHGATSELNREAIDAAFDAVGNDEE